MESHGGHWIFLVTSLRRFLITSYRVCTVQSNTNVLSKLHCVRYKSCVVLAGLSTTCNIVLSKKQAKHKGHWYEHVHVHMAGQSAVCTSCTMYAGYLLTPLLITAHVRYLMWFVQHGKPVPGEPYCSQTRRPLSLYDWKANGTSTTK